MRAQIIARVAGLALGLALFGCQRLDFAEPKGTGQTAADEDTGFDTFSPGETDEGGDDRETECNPVSQSGCDTGEKCAAVRSGRSEIIYACVPDSGNIEPFGPCTASLDDGRDGCTAGYVCLEAMDEDGVCVPLCLTNADCSDGLCVYHSTDNVPHCAAECNPFVAMCIDPMQCRRASDRFVCKFPAVGDTGVQGEACVLEEDAGCTAGLVCIPGALVTNCTDPSCCTTLCDVTAADRCPGASTCNPLFSTPSPGHDHVGACFVPA